MVRLCSVMVISIVIYSETTISLLYLLLVVREYLISQIKNGVFTR
uniref:Uncharacterized protein n=1 Tax=Arundo donax TaxID=35708 RepID=A0A0A9HHN1_ARUDO